MSSVSANDLERRREIEQLQPLLTQARVALRRLDFQTALQQCAVVLQRMPDSVAALEIKGDVHRALGEHDAALAAFEQALKLDPSVRRLGDKFALVCIERDETKRIEERQKVALANPERFRKGQKNPLWSFLLSSVLPGMGQMYNDEYPKGFVVLGVFLFSSYFALWALWLIAHSMGGALSLAALQKPFETMGVGKLLWLLFNSVLSGAAYTYSIVDAPITTMRLNKQQAAEWGLDPEPESGLKKKI